MDNMTREQIEAEIRALDALMREKDYIGIKIAMGRATVEEYAEEIAESDRMAAKKNELMAMLKQMDEEECNKGCREYGNCGECENYHIPYSQEPCNNCEYLKVGANINREGGKDGNR